jgi:hypothetical protein
LLEHLHHGVELAPGDSAIAAVVNLGEGSLNVEVRGALVRGNILFNVVVELIEIDIAISIGVNVLEDEGGPLGGALDEVGKLVLRDATIAVGINNLVEGVELGVIDNLAVHAGCGLELSLGNLAITVRIEHQEHLIDLLLGLV